VAAVVRPGLGTDAEEQVPAELDQLPPLSFRVEPVVGPVGFFKAIVFIVFCLLLSFLSFISKSRCQCYPENQSVIQILAVKVGVNTDLFLKKHKKDRQNLREQVQLCLTFLFF
jgi:hypothetical protein